MARNTNRKDGLQFETELCQMMADKGWWCHNIAQTAAGQPADVIAVRLNTAVLIDCKVCSGDKFLMSRVEPNQESAMTLWQERDNVYAYFAIKFPSGKIYMMHYDSYIFLKKENVKAVPEEYAIAAFRRIDRWLDYMEDQI